MLTLTAIKKYPFITYIYAQTAVLACVVWFLNRHLYFDDAYISLRYARNLLDGQGMVWQAGERVEGYTNFLYIVFEAMLGWLGIDLIAASRIISFSAFFGILAVIVWYTRKTIANPAPNERLASALAVSLVGSSVPLLAWCMGGLESDLFAFFVTAGVCCTLSAFEHKPRAALIGILFAMATLTRFEGGIFFVVTFLFLVCARRRSFGIKNLLVMGFAYTAIVLPYMAWRVMYFGDVLPNTYYAKVGSVSSAMTHAYGLFYLLEYACLLPPLLPLMAVCMVVVLLAKRQCPPAVAYLALMVTVFFAYIVQVGGDYMSYFRFMVPVIPLLALLIYHGGLAFLKLHKEKWFRDILGALLALSVFQMGVLSDDSSASPGALSGRAVSEYVQFHWPKDSLIAMNPMGTLPYLAPQYRYLDMLGLLDKTIAHRNITAWNPKVTQTIGHMKGDGEYVLSRKPDYIIWGMAWGSDKPIYLSEVEMDDLPEFHKQYHKVETYITPPVDLAPVLEKLAKKDPEVRLNAEGQLRFIYYQRKND